MTATATAAMTRVVNPYAKRSQNVVNMGRQSQQRVSNRVKRKHKLATNHNNNKRKKGDQLTLLGDVAFDSRKDCEVCKARHLRTFIEGYRIPKRGHHSNCSRNTKTQGRGELSELQKISLEDNIKYKNLVKPITTAEKGSSRNLPRDRGEFFFGPRQRVSKMTTASAGVVEGHVIDDLTPSYFC